MELVLASKSPRRRELLALMGLTQFTVRPALGEETVPEGLSPEKLVEMLSRKKAREVAGRSAPDALVLAADTVVSQCGRVFGKPRDEDEAVEMLMYLSGRLHIVYTGVTLRQESRICTEHEKTLVYLRDITRDEARAYVATGEPMDKAGAYGIQGLGSVLVRSIEGDYYNVVGLPLYRVSRMLEGFGVSVQDLWH